MGRPKVLTDTELKIRTRECVDKYHQTPIGRATHLLTSYRHSDKISNRGECTLTAQWIVDNIFSQPCSHCGKTGWNIIGCNRLDNSKPHTPDNVEPCCFDCNRRYGGRTKRKRGKYIERMYQYSLDGKLIAIHNGCIWSKVPL